MVQLASFDILAPGLPVVFCGINPSTAAAASGHNFGSPSNRFWRVLHLAGFTPTHLTAQDDRRILEFGCGITAAAMRPTRRADELNGQELAAAGDLLKAKLAQFQPDTIAFLGKAAYAALSNQANIAWGAQSAPYGGAAVWVLPNPSGLNRSFTLPRLVASYEALRAAKFHDFARWRSGAKTSMPGTAQLSPGRG